MGRADQAGRLAPYAKELVGNAYAQENLREGVEKLSAAYRRARKRRVEPTQDKRLRRQLQSAAQSITEAGQALRDRRQQPKPRWGRRLVVIGGLAVTAGVVAYWAGERLGEQPAAPPAARSETQPEQAEAGRAALA
jgi:hypothetical protein